MSFFFYLFFYCTNISIKIENLYIANTTIIINPEYEGLSNEALLTSSNWVHHVPYILPQGRTTWVNPSSKEEGGEEGGEEENEDEENEDGDGDSKDASEAAEPETGPAILSPLASDEGESFFSCLPFT
jgi:radial spoke head protein 4/6